MTTISPRQGYERITYTDPDTGKSVTHRYKVDSEGPQLLLLTPVNEEGEDQSFFNGDGVLVEKMQLLDVTLITRRVSLRWNLTYGTLEVDR